MLPITFEEESYCEIISDHLILENDKEYVCVITERRYMPVSTDFSIFTPKEWNTLLVISEQFENEIYRSRSYSPWEYKQLSEEIKSAIYFLSQKCEFCDIGFSEFETLTGTKSEILNFILEKSRSKPITIDMFRRWVVKSWNVIEDKLRVLSE